MARIKRLRIRTLKKKGKMVELTKENKKIPVPFSNASPTPRSLESTIKNHTHSLPINRHAEKSVQQIAIQKTEDAPAVREELYATNKTNDAKGTYRIAGVTDTEHTYSTQNTYQEAAKETKERVTARSFTGGREERIGEDENMKRAKKEYEPHEHNYQLTKKEKRAL